MTRPLPSIPWGTGLYPKPWGLDRDNDIRDDDPQGFAAQPTSDKMSEVGHMADTGQRQDPEEIQEGNRNFESIEDIDQGAQTSLELKNYVRPDGELPPRLGPRGVPISGLDPSRVGGWQRMDSAFDETNARGQEAIQEAGDIASAEAQDLTVHYGKLKEEADTIRATRLDHHKQNIAGLQQRQAELEKQTQVYSQNLADRGAFWKNPGNVVSAIAFSLLPLAGVTGGVGMRLVNQAIQQDLADRKALADSHLGALKSNLSGYRQLTGEIEAGDALAEVEAYRIASLEVQRIASQYQSQKVQSTAKAMMAHLNGELNRAYMDYHSRLINIDPALVDPRIKAAREARPGYQNYLPGSKPGGSTPTGVSAAGNPGQVPGAVPSTPTAGVPGDVQSRAIQSLGGKPKQVKPGEELMPGARVADAADQPLGGPGNPDPSSMDTRTLIERRAPQLSKALAARSPLAMQSYDYIDRELKVKAQREALKSADPGLNPRAYQRAFLAAWDAEWDRIEAQKGEVAKAADKYSQDFANYSRIQKAVADVEAAFGGDMRKANDFMNGFWAAVAPGTTQNANELINKLGLQGDSLADKKLAAAMRFRQMVGGTVADHYHKIAGANMTDNELEILSRDLPKNPSFEQFRGFVFNRSRALGGQYKNALDHAPSPIAKLLYISERGTRQTGITSEGQKEQKKPKRIDLDPNTRTPIKKY